MTPSSFRAVLALSATLGLLPLGLPVAASATQAAESAFGCKGLEENRELPSVEGKEGFFFRVFADLRMQHPMSDHVATQLGQLAAALKEKGTTLLYVPIPTKSQTLPSFLPDDVHLYGFDKDVAVAVYKDQIARLRAQGVVAVDLLEALASTDAQNPPFFRSDFHWTSDGARLAAEAIGGTIKTLPDYAEVTPTKYETTRMGDELAVSGMRRTLQAYCALSLPPVVTKAFETVEVASTEASVDIFGTSSPEGGTDEIALVGTSFSDAEVPNFGGFLAEYSSLPVSNQAITGGNQFGAITSYLTSRSFAETRPRYLVWENPIYNNLAQFGIGPMTELIAAARNDCAPIDRAAIKSGEDNTLEVDLSAVAIDTKQVLLADAGDDGSRDVVFSFETADGKTLSREVHRGDRFRGTGRYFIPLESLASDDLTRLVISFDRVNSESAGVSLCNL
jgi:alginate biosynthesis protein AlgX